MADLDPAHVEAVALVVDGCTESVWHASDERTIGPWKRAAERILTSTDPAVHAALLAALVRAEALEEYIEEKPFLKPRPQRRSVYFTRWEDVDA